MFPRSPSKPIRRAAKAGEPWAIEAEARRLLERRQRPKPKLLARALDIFKKEDR